MPFHVSHHKYTRSLKVFLLEFDSVKYKVKEKRGVKKKSQVFSLCSHLCSHTRLLTLNFRTLKRDPIVLLVLCSYNMVLISAWELFYFSIVAFWSLDKSVRLTLHPVPSASRVLIRMKVWRHTLIPGSRFRFVWRQFIFARIKTRSSKKGRRSRVSRNRDDKEGQIEECRLK